MWQRPRPRGISSQALSLFPPLSKPTGGQWGICPPPLGVSGKDAGVGAGDLVSSSDPDTGWLCHLDESLPFPRPQFPFLRSEAYLFCSPRTFCVQAFCDSVRVGGLQDLGAMDLDKELNLQEEQWPMLLLAPKHILNLNFFLHFYSK